jgi:dTDP-4-dehydrorhamnose reductase
MSFASKYGNGGTPSLPVWITGAAGLIGSHLVQTAPRFAPGFDVIGLARPQLDLTDFAAVRREFARQQPRLVIHCAALSRSPACEENPSLARLANVDATRNLAELAADIPFIFFSTDLVFDGQKGNYIETDVVNPLGVYAETKVAAEGFVRSHPRHLILRAALNAGPSPTGDRAFDEQMRLAWRAGRAVNLFTDEFRCPIPAAVTARSVWELVAKNQTGTFHLGGAERLSRHEIGELVAARYPELKPQIIPGSLKEYRGAPRPPDVSLNCAKVQAALSFPLPKFSEWLAANPHEA